MHVHAIALQSENILRNQVREASWLPMPVLTPAGQEASALGQEGHLFWSYQTLIALAEHRSTIQMAYQFLHAVCVS